MGKAEEREFIVLVSVGIFFLLLELIFVYFIKKMTTDAEEAT